MFIPLRFVLAEADLRHWSSSSAIWDCLTVLIVARPRPFFIKVHVFAAPRTCVARQSAERVVLLGSFGTGSVRVGGRPSSLEAASSQTWASCLRDTRTSFAFASRAHLKHSSAIARYSAAVFIGRCAPFSSEILCRFAKFVCFRPDSTKDLLNGPRIVAAGTAPVGAAGLGRDKIIRAATQ
jgi:hypothetical protein